MRIAIASLLSGPALPSPISVLPPELLVRIFLLADVIYDHDWEDRHFSTQPDYSLDRAWVRRSLELSHVCRKWRAVALSIRTLWDSPNLTFADNCMDFEIADRAAGSSLKLIIDHPDPSKHVRWFHMLKERMPCVQSLMIWSSVSSVQSILQNASALKALCILDVYEEGVSISRGEHAFYAPALATLAMQVRVGFPYPLLANITRLHLDTREEVTDLLELNEILVILSHTPFIRELCVRFPGRDPWLRGNPPLEEITASKPVTPHLSHVTLIGNYTLSTALYRKLDVDGRPLKITLDDGRKHVHESCLRAMRAFLRDFTSRPQNKPIAAKMITEVHMGNSELKVASIELIPAIVDGTQKHLVLTASSTEFVSWGFSDRFLEMIFAINRERLRHLNMESQYEFGSPISFSTISSSMPWLEEIRMACPMIINSFLSLLGTQTDGKLWLHQLTKVTIAGIVITTEQNAGDRRVRKQECVLDRLVDAFTARAKAGHPLKKLVLEKCDYGVAGEDAVLAALCQWVDEVDMGSRVL